MVKIRIKKSNSKEYYYLEHTIRQGDKFKNKRIYLGNKIPKNIDKIKEEFLYELFEETYAKKLNEIKKNFKKELKTFPNSAKKKYLDNFMIKFTYNSNRIEGNTLTLKETADLLEDEITPKNKPLKDVKETESHKNVFFDMLEYDKDISLGTVLHWHKLLLENVDLEIAGKIRNHPVTIARSKVVLPIPAELNTLLHDFFTWYNQYKSKLNPVLLSALVHLKFVSIHPFSDGNGRISRIMMNYILNKHGFPMLNIEYNNRKAYYDALEHSQLKGKDNYFLHYVLKRFIKAYERYLTKS